jgi:hypothetical protein
VLARQGMAQLTASTTNLLSLATSNEWFHDVSSQIDQPETLTTRWLQGPLIRHGISQVVAIKIVGSSARPTFNRGSTQGGVDPVPGLTGASGPAWCRVRASRMHQAVATCYSRLKMSEAFDECDQRTEGGYLDAVVRTPSMANGALMLEA